MADTSTAAAQTDLQVGKLKYHDTGRFSQLILDYLDNHSNLDGLYAWSRNESGLQAAMQAMDSRSWPREALAEALQDTYRDIEHSDAVSSGIQKLSDEALAVVTAHQLNLFSGPLYVVLKAAAVVAAARNWEAKFPGRQFVPVFWLGSEDHDFEEINHFNLFGQKWAWEREASGATGRMKVDEELQRLGQALKERLGDSPQAQELAEIFDYAYQPGDSLARAHTRLLNRLFGAHGLVVLDADHKALKVAFSEVLSRELTEQPAVDVLKPALEQLEANYHVQASPRRINLFWMKEDLRPRLEKEGDGPVFTVDADQTWSLEEIAEELEKHPERFSPNVILRPIYQQAVLPSIAYIGGGGELAYWLELRPLFEAYDAFYPLLLLRNSVMWMDQGSVKKLDQLQLKAEDLFQEEEGLVKAWVAEHAEGDFDLEVEKKTLTAFYDQLSQRVLAIDSGLKGRMEADKSNQLKSLDKLEGRLIKSAKQKHETDVKKIRALVDRFFPNRGLQERRENFAGIWLRQGSAMIDTLIQELDPLDERFTIIQERKTGH